MSDNKEMTRLRYKASSLSLAVAASLLLHGLFVFGLTGIGGIGLVAAFSDSSLTAYLLPDPTGGPASPNPQVAAAAARAGAAPPLIPAGRTVALPPLPQEESAPPPEPEALKPAPTPEASALPPPVETAQISSAAPAETPPPAEASRAAPPQQPVAGLAALFGGGRESLGYDIYWSGIYVGQATLEARSSEDEVTITSQVRSAPVISAFYKVDDASESRIVDGMPAHFKIKQREGKYRSDKETVFDSAAKKVTFFNHLKGTKNEHPLPAPLTWDVISGFYYLRTQPLEVGAPVYIDVFDSNKFIRVEVKVLGREMAMTELPGIGTVATIKVQPVLTTDGLFKKTGEIYIWLTDDERRIPVRVETQVPIGTVVARLRSLHAAQ